MRMPEFTMAKTIFISCGQFTPAEKRLGLQIAEMVRDLTDCVPFFAEEVQDLNGLDTNILGALRECVGFITVMHPRGEIRRPDGSIHVRASVWIEQEIALATYIQRFEDRPIPIVAFKLPAQTVDATPSNAQIRRSFLERRDLFDATPSNPSQGSVPAVPVLRSDSAFIFSGIRVRAECCTDPLKPPHKSVSREGIRDRHCGASFRSQGRCKSLDRRERIQG
jgi:hypothetical protein